MDEKHTKTITLTLTQNCNLSCTYCYEHHKSMRAMHFQTARHIIDYEFAHRESWVERLEFDLFGGEPFLEFDLLKDITEYICSVKGDFPCTVFATTNGTLIHGKIQEWLKDHSGCFVCGLSLDGTREMHNVNRSDSYDDIDLAFFLQQYPTQDVKMTISQETLPHLADGVIALQKMGFFVSCNLAYGIDWGNADNLHLLHRELEKLITFYLQNPQYTPCSMLEMGITNIGAEEVYAVRYCGAGKYMRAYDVDGRYYPCQFFMPLSVGEEKAAAVKDIEFPDFAISESVLDEKCQKCVARSACPNCFGSNYAATGSIYKRDENLCKLTKVILKARSYFRAKQWEAGTLQGSPDEIDATLRAIIRIQEELSI